MSRTNSKNWDTSDDCLRRHGDDLFRTRPTFVDACPSGSTGTADGRIYVGMTHPVGFVIISGEFGGAETMVYHLLEDIDKSNFEPYLFANETVVDDFRDIAGVSTVSLGSLSYYSYPAFLGLDGQYRSALGVLVEHCKANEISLLVCNLPGSLFLARRIEDVSRVFIMHGQMRFEDESFKIRNDLSREQSSVQRFKRTVFREVRARLNARLLQTVDHVVLTCEYFGTLLAGQDINVDTSVIPNGVDTGIIEDRTEVVDDERFSIFYSGGTRDVKGWDLLVQAGARLAAEGKEFVLYVLRDVPEDHYMRHFIADNGLSEHVVFVGYLPRESYLDYLYSCDLFCLPSYSESIPMSALDALALGKPVVATDVGGTSEIIAHETNGYLCETTPESVASGISYFLDSPDRIPAVEKRNLRTVERFDWARIIEAYEALFRRMLNR